MAWDNTESKSGAMVVKLSTFTPLSSLSASHAVATELFQGEFEAESKLAAALIIEHAKTNDNSTAKTSIDLRMVLTLE